MAASVAKRPGVDHSIGQQSEASKTLRDELGGNFQRLGSRVAESLRAVDKPHWFTLIRKGHFPYQLLLSDLLG